MCNPLGLGDAHMERTSSSSREVRTRAPFFAVVEFSRGTESPNQKRGEKGHLAGGPSQCIQNHAGHHNHLAPSSPERRFPLPSSAVQDSAFTTTSTQCPPSLRNLRHSAFFVLNFAYWKLPSSVLRCCECCLDILGVRQVIQHQVLVWVFRV